MITLICYYNGLDIRHISLYIGPVIEPYAANFTTKVVIQDKFLIDDGKNEPTISPVSSEASRRRSPRLKSVGGPQRKGGSLDSMPFQVGLLDAKKEGSNRHSAIGRLQEEKSFMNSPSVWFNKDSNETNILKDGIFLGMAAVRVQPRPEVQNFIDILYNAGVRFVHFSPDSYRKSKTLASKMGLETGWNCAISLKSKDQKPPLNHSLSTWDEKARLPHGIEEIRRHLDQTDNVPLLVSLFTESTPQTAREMIQIMQENGEVVAAVGSAMCLPNMSLFQTADIGIAVHPILPPLHAKHAPSKPDISFGAALNALPCNVHIRSTTNLRALCVGIHEGRRLMYNTRNVLLFFGFIHILVCCILVMYQFSNMPFFGTGLAAMYILWVILPVIR